ncbi:MAG: hypothetical protein ACPGN3_13830 [Opitutales bacterium]
MEAAPSLDAPAIILLVLFGLALLLNLYYTLRLIILAFAESVLWGLGFLFVPFVSLIFIFKYWHMTKGFFLKYLATVAAFFVMAVAFPAIVAVQDASALKAFTAGAESEIPQGPLSTREEQLVGKWIGGNEAGDFWEIERSTDRSYRLLIGDIHNLDSVDYYEGIWGINSRGEYSFIDTASSSKDFEIDIIPYTEKIISISDKRFVTSFLDDKNSTVQCAEERIAAFKLEAWRTYTK